MKYIFCSILAIAMLCNADAYAAGGKKKARKKAKIACGKSKCCDTSNCIKDTKCVPMPGCRPS